MSPVAVGKTTIESPTQLEGIVHLNLSCPPEEEDDLKIGVSSRVFFNSNVPKVLEDDKITYCYDPDREAIHIKLPSIFRNCPNRYLGNTFLNMCKCDGFFPPLQKSQVYYSRSPVRLRGSLSRTSMLKNEPWYKNPDGLFEILDPLHETFYPKIAIEIGFTHKHDELLLDMKQWLLKCPTMSAVILVNFSEHDRPTISTLDRTARQRVRSLIEDYGNDKCRGIHGDEFDVPDDGNDDSGSVTSSPEMYNEIGTRVYPDDWAGCLSATIEIWEAKNKTPVLRSHVTLETEQLPPHLLLSDFFGRIEPDKVIPLDMDAFCWYLNIVRNELAKDRAIRFLRRRDS